MKMRDFVFAVALGAVAVGCSKSEGQATKAHAESAPASAAPAQLGTAKELFAGRCSLCHGTSGMGDGPGAAALNPKPRNYTDKDWQASVTDEELKKVIVGGGASVGKSAGMPPNPDLAGKPQLDELVAIVRSFGK